MKNTFWSVFIKKRYFYEQPLCISSLEFLLIGQHKKGYSEQQLTEVQGKLWVK